jgi:hypothetical protein
MDQEDIERNRSSTLKGQAIEGKILWRGWTRLQDRAVVAACHKMWVMVSLLP